MCCCESANGRFTNCSVNLQDNPENVGKKLTIKGKFRTYFGIGGLRDVNKSDSYKLE